MTSTALSMKECIDVCLECHRVCLETLQYCLKQGGRHVEASHIQLLQNCASICETNAQFLISGSELHATTCKISPQRSHSISNVRDHAISRKRSHSISSEWSHLTSQCA